MNTSELQLPKKIFPVEYAGFFDFNEEGIYDTSVINRDDYPNAEQIANEMSKRYNNFENMKEALAFTLRFVNPNRMSEQGLEKLKRYQTLLSELNK